jgi:hypothetical protein
MDDKIKKMVEARKGVKSENNPVRKFFYSEKPSKTMAIKAMCAFCNGCEEEHMEPGFRTEIKNCKFVKCPLHAFRPYQ